MKSGLSGLLLMFSIMGCGSWSLPKTEDQKMLWSRKQVSSEGIDIQLKRGDRPKFERVYSRQLDNRAKLIVTYYTSYSGDRYNKGEIDQPDGKWISFDPDAVADKILDPYLVPLVQDYCNRIKAIDQQFISSKPSEFTDEGGTTWDRRSK